MWWSGRDVTHQLCVDLEQTNEKALLLEQLGRQCVKTTKKMRRIFSSLSQPNSPKLMARSNIFCNYFEHPNAECVFLMSASSDNLQKRI